MIQLYETMLTRHTTMIVGPTGSGKSVIINQLAKALAEDQEYPVKIDTINPKMITNHELYGVLDPESRDWTDGLLSKLFKEANRPRTEEDKPETRWILYDGDVDAVWVENMNSVMDDNIFLRWRMVIVSVCKIGVRCCLRCLIFSTLHPLLSPVVVWSMLIRRIWGIGLSMSGG